MQLPKFIQFVQDGTTYIMSTDQPCYIGKVVQFEDNSNMLDWIARTKVNKDRCICGQVPGYSILVVFNGCMDGLNCPLPESAYIFKQMALWYLNEKIMGKGRYNKYLQNA